ncbi:hypothetical protein HBI56_215080 [Parastagonospora nodorum]|uniref:Uncharacterized protein n=1 Tax=Phaeosphaeria nodorum (strain SN15 / ATCC MYA-4574 / FGSC 10173) TaxID=321614 RepID=A0A7U2F6M0_PHANO|nr:hypothetical protein HBH56_231040 [Parastagonospora nodorum]QRC99456.1 hypothetical protein JI435_413500 [Parastagonospora nodorum SN15]KAH3924386.1 hypothetical protein HBH54_194120 [Parastagonospora nodorum]KAH3940184.1 hypothetical protein HBH53_221690 [Parastagonospora nodorum]KAH3958341.1 hypothetical protein HBH51_210760 [Parastagonospora nodorum]
MSLKPCIQGVGTMTWAASISMEGRRREVLVGELSEIHPGSMYGKNWFPCEMDALWRP